MGDVGDYVKYALVRRLAEGRRLGVAWYLFPNESHNADGKHVRYLEEPNRWRAYDPELYDRLQGLLQDGRRSVKAIQEAGILPDAAFHSEPLVAPGTPAAQRRHWRAEWFNSALDRLRDRDIVFADPDNGLCEDSSFRGGRIKDWKRLPLSEAMALCQGRTGILYHHNSRFKGGHLAEIQHWMEKLPAPSLAVRWRRYSARTFFVVNPSSDIAERIRAFVEDWRDHCELVE